MTEMCLPIPGFDGYEVSSEGGSDRCPVRPLPPRSHYPVDDGQMLALIPNKRTGYLRVNLHRDGQGATSMRIHSAVLMTFVGPCPLGSDF
jgi:hypothetical protein